MSKPAPVACRVNMRSSRRASFPLNTTGTAALRGHRRAHGLGAGGRGGALRARRGHRRRAASIRHPADPRHRPRRRCARLLLHGARHHRARGRRAGAARTHAAGAVAIRRPAPGDRGDPGDGGRDGRGRPLPLRQWRLRALLRPARDRIIGHTAIEVLGAEEVARRPPWMLRAFAGESVTFTLDDAGPEGTTWLELSCIPLLLGGEGVDGFVGVVTDITSQRREQDRLTALSQRDPLTGLLNRAGFEQFLERQAQAGLEATLGLLYVDLDHSVRAWAWRSASRPWRAGTSRSAARTRRSIERGRPVADAIRARARQVRPPVAWAASPGHATPSCPAVRRTARGSARPPCAGPPCWLRHAGRARRCAAPRGSC